MQNRPVDNVEKLKKFLGDQGYNVEETSSGMRIRLKSEYDIDVNALIRDSEFFWSSLTTAKISAEKLQATLADIRDEFSSALEGLATLGEFEETQEEDDRFMFVAEIELLPSVDYHGVVDIGVPADEVAQGDEAPELSEPELEPEPEPEGETELHIEAELLPDLPGQATEIMTAEKAVVLLETVDGKMLRQSLDMMNLRRSSNIRLALTRIFRNAMDSESLISSVQEEAGKIVSTDDLQELEMIKVVSATGFLQPVVELLYQEVFQK
jgi:hypothetical protein